MFSAHALDRSDIRRKQNQQKNACILEDNTLEDSSDDCSPLQLQKFDPHLLSRASWKKRKHVNLYQEAEPEKSLKHEEGPKS